MNEQVREQSAGGSSLPLWIAIALAVAGVVGYYMLGGQAAWVRWLLVAGGLIAGALVFGLSSGAGEFKRFAVDARNELRKVFWPTRDEAWKITGIVFLFAGIAGVFFWLLDLFLAWGTRYLTGQGG
jgi:preprotein translocase subunit SecE